MSLCQGRGHKPILLAVQRSWLQSNTPNPGGHSPQLRGHRGPRHGQPLLPYHGGELSHGAEAGRARGAGAASRPRAQPAGVTVLARRGPVTDARAMLCHLPSGPGCPKTFTSLPRKSDAMGSPSPKETIPVPTAPGMDSSPASPPLHHVLLAQLKPK